VIRPADKPQTPEDVVVPSEEPEAKSTNTAVLVVAIVVPVVIVVVVAIVLITCLLKRNRRSAYEGFNDFYYDVYVLLVKEENTTTKSERSSLYEFTYFFINIFSPFIPFSENDNFETYSNSSNGVEELARADPTSHSKRMEKSVEMDEMMVWMELFNKFIYIHIDFFFLFSLLKDSGISVCDDTSRTTDVSSQKEKGSVRSYRGTISQSYRARSAETGF
jgi:hypothetical protein